MKKIFTVRIRRVQRDANHRTIAGFTCVRVLCLGDAFCSEQRRTGPRTSPRSIGRAAARELRELQAKLARDSQNLPLALDLAKHCIVRARAEADPRFLGYAEAALGYWSNLAQPPASVLVVRATIRQSNHDFARALADLDLAVKLDPNNTQAWLTRASIFQVQGRYTEAKRAFLPTRPAHIGACGRHLCERHRPV